MRTRTWAYGLAAGLAVLAPISAAGAAPARATGVVVDYRAQAGTATVATPAGRLMAVHTARRVRPGARVRLSGLTALANGTYSGTPRVLGVARRARIRGTVVAHVGAHAVAVSTRGATFVVHVGGRRRGGIRASERSGRPPVGTTVGAVVTIGDHGRLDCDGMSPLAPPAAGDAVDVEGRVSAVDPEARTLTLVAEDDGLRAEFTIGVPDTIDISAYTVGDEVEVTVVIGADGSFTLQGSSLNGDDREADDPADAQGEREADDPADDQGEREDVADARDPQEHSAGDRHGGCRNDDADAEDDAPASPAPPATGL